MERIADLSTRTTMVAGRCCCGGHIRSLARNKASGTKPVALSACDTFVERRIVDAVGYIKSRPSEARNLLAPVYGWFTEGFDTPDLKQAKAL